MFYQIFLSPQVKRCAIITYKNCIYELPHELPNELRLYLFIYSLFIADSFINEHIHISKKKKTSSSQGKTTCEAK